MKSKRGYIFDFDGVIMDSERYTYPSVIEVVAAYGCVLTDFDEDAFSGAAWQDIESAVKARLPELEQRSLADDFAAAFHRRVLDGSTPLIPGVDQAIERASTLGAVAVATASRGALVRRALTAAQLDKFVGCVVSADDCDRPKPDPQCFELAAQSLGVALSDSIIFEDSVVGLTAARATVATVVAIHHGRPMMDRAWALCDQAAPNFIALLDTPIFASS